MEINNFIKKINKIKLIAHRLGYQMTKYPENSIEALETIFKNKELLDACDGFEFDICFTKDHVPVVIHDKYIDDITDKTGKIKKYNFEELKKLKFKFRKSIQKHDNNISYEIVTLEEILHFFQKNINLLKNKMIKIETKDYIFTTKDNLNTKDLEKFTEVINKFPKLTKNIIHLSFWPLNLLFFRKIQLENNNKIIKNELLCDYGFLLFFSRFLPYLDHISLRIKTKNLPKKNKNNSKKVNKKIASDIFWMNFSNAIKEKNLKYIINKYGSVGLYTLNDIDEIKEICQNISDKFFLKNYKNMIITTNNPIYLKKTLYNQKENS